jgi:hypothetical protein
VGHRQPGFIALAAGIDMQRAAAIETIVGLQMVNSSVIPVPG